MNIRRAVLTDKQELIRLMIEFEEVTEKMLPKQQREIRAFENVEKKARDIIDEYLSQQKYILFVAEEAGVLKGFSCGEIKEKKYRVHNKEGYISDLFIDKDCQGQGLGKRLLNTLTEAFVNAGCTHLGLDTHIENKEAMKFYEYMGFTKRLVTFFKLLNSLNRNKFHTHL